MAPRQAAWRVRPGNALYGLAGDPEHSDGSVTSLGRHDSAEACWAACNATTQHACKQWVWHSPHFGGGGKWARACFQVRRWPPLIVPDEHVISGVLYAEPVWRATGCARLPPPACLSNTASGSTRAAAP